MLILNDFFGADGETRTIHSKFQQVHASLTSLIFIAFLKNRLLEIASICTKVAMKVARIIHAIGVKSIAIGTTEQRIKLIQ